MTELTALAERLEALIRAWPDEVPSEAIATEARRVRALVEMVEEGLITVDD